MYVLMIYGTYNINGVSDVYKTFKTLQEVKSFIIQYDKIESDPLKCMYGIIDVCGNRWTEISDTNNSLYVKEYQKTVLEWLDDIDWFNIDGK